MQHSMKYFSYVQKEYIGYQDCCCYVFSKLEFDRVIKLQNLNGWEQANELQVSNNNASVSLIISKEHLFFVTESFDTLVGNILFNYCL